MESHLFYSGDHFVRLYARLEACYWIFAVRKYCKMIMAMLSGLTTVVLQTGPRQIRRTVVPMLLICATALFAGCTGAHHEPAKDSAASSEKTSPGEGAGSGQNSEQTGSHPAEEAKIFAGKPSRLGDSTVSFPLHFHAGPGQNIGLIHVKVSVPGDKWKFLTLDAPPNSRLEVSVEKLGEQEGEQEGTLKLEISNGSHAIPNGLVGSLKFSLPVPQGGEMKSPTVLILDAWPPEKHAASGTDGGGGGSDSREPSVDAPVPMGPQNPAMGCFFFTH